jgi:adenylate kinase
MKVFIAGLSKSGKSTDSQYAAAQRTDLEYVSVSALLKATGGILPVETFADALFNQQKAADILLDLSPSQKHQIIDGHALIETREGPIPVPDRFFEALKPDLLIYVQEELGELYARRAPFGMLEKPAEIAALMVMERAICDRIAVRREIPLMTVHAPTLDSFIARLNQYLDQ